MIHISQNDDFIHNVGEIISCENSWIWHNGKYVASQHFLQKYHEFCETKLFLFFDLVIFFRIDDISIGFRLAPNQELTNVFRNLFLTFFRKFGRSCFLNSDKEGWAWRPDSATFLKWKENWYSYLVVSMKRGLILVPRSQYEQKTSTRTS